MISAILASTLAVSSPAVTLPEVNPTSLSSSNVVQTSSSPYKSSYKTFTKKTYYPTTKRRTVKKVPVRAKRYPAKPAKSSFYYARTNVRRSYKPAYATPYSASVNTKYSREEVKSIIDRYAQKYGVNADRANRIAQCESGYNPSAFNPSSAASGVFQQLQRYWPDRANQYGRAEASVFDAEANIDVSMQMLSKGMWSHWSCKG